MGVTRALMGWLLIIFGISIFGLGIWIASGGSKSVPINVIESSDQEAKANNNQDNPNPPQDAASGKGNGHANGSQGVSDNNHSKGDTSGGIRWTDKAQFILNFVLTLATVSLAVYAAKTLHQIRTDSKAQSTQFTQQLGLTQQAANAATHSAGAAINASEAAASQADTMGKTLNQMTADSEAQGAQFAQQLAAVQRQILAAEAANSESAEANNIARASMVIQNRAWLVPYAEIKSVSFNNRRPSFTYSIAVQNIGTQPAYGAFTRAKIHPISIATGLRNYEAITIEEAFNRFREELEREPTLPEWMRETSTDVSAMSSNMKGFRLFPNQAITTGTTERTPGFELVQNPVSPESRAIQPIIFVGVSYRTPGSQERHYTIEAYDLGHIASYETLSGASLKVRPYFMPVHWQAQK